MMMMMMIMMMITMMMTQMLVETKEKAASVGDELHQMVLQRGKLGGGFQQQYDSSTYPMYRNYDETLNMQYIQNTNSNMNCIRQFCKRGNDDDDDDDDDYDHDHNDVDAGKN